MNKKAIILFGPPGAGKGTQSELLAEKLGLFLFETSKILEQKFRETATMSESDPNRFIEFEGQKFDPLEEQKLWKQGIINSPPFVTRLVIEKLRQIYEDGESVVLAGSPRTVYEAERIMPLLSDWYGENNIYVMMIEISAEVTVFRNTHRKICELIRHSIMYNEETANLTKCPLDGSKLVTRKNLDDPETIRTRLEQYQERTLPLFGYFSGNKFNIHKISGEASASQVHENILRIIQ